MRKYLLDTSIIYWMYFAPEKLSHTEQTILTDDLNTLFVSPISLMEISIKYRLGKAPIGELTPEQLLQNIQEDGFEILPLYAEDAISLYHLPLYQDHRDPFDRIIAHQAVRNSLILMTHDLKMKRYTSEGLLLTD